jgi:glycosyltransferase involved in cell wall biosynthesis
MKILLIVTGLNIGGAERQVSDLAIHFSKSHTVRILTLTAPTAFCDELMIAGVEIVSLNMKIGRPSLLALLRGRRLVKEFQPTVVHSHMFHANIYARILRLVVPMPVLISSIHSSYERSRRSRSTREITWRERAYTLTDRLSDTTTQLSNVGLERYLRIGAISAARAIIIPNGVDFSKFTIATMGGVKINISSMEERENFKWLAVGRLENAKNYPLMIEAAKGLVNDGVHFQLEIVGDGSQRELLNAMVKELNLTRMITFLGARDDVPRLMHQANGYVMSSNWEGLPLVLIEAAASGLVIVATDVGANSDVIKDNETGFLVESQNIVSLKNAMRSVMDLSNDARGEMGIRARQFVKSRFEIQKVGCTWLALYEKLAKKSPLRRYSEGSLVSRINER